MEDLHRDIEKKMQRSLAMMSDIELKEANSLAGLFQSIVADCKVRKTGITHSKSVLSSGEKFLSETKKSQRPASRVCKLSFPEYHKYPLLTSIC